MRDMSNTEIRRRQLHGRRHGHALRRAQAALVEDLLPKLSLPEAGELSSHELFGDARPLWLEIGFGKGEHLGWQAAENPDVGFIGCEPFINGIVGALAEVRDRGLSNVLLHMDDARDVLDRLPDASVSRIFLLHPDPWPKARHARRRFINPEPLDQIARVLKPGGEFRLGTDDPTYCRWSMMIMNAREDFEWTARSADDFLVRPDDWPQTRYEAKARKAGREVWYFQYRRR